MRACTEQALLVPSWPENVPAPPLGCVNPRRFLFRPDYRDPSEPLSSLHPSFVPSSCQQKRCWPRPWAPLSLRLGYVIAEADSLALRALSKNISPSHPGPPWPFRSSLSYCSVRFYPACAPPDSSLSSGFYNPAVWNQHPGDPVWRPVLTSDPEIKQTKYAPNPHQTSEEDRPAQSILGAEHPKKWKLTLMSTAEGFFFFLKIWLDFKEKKKKKQEKCLTL